LDLEDFVLVALETVKLEFQVSEVPKSDCFVRRASGQDELGVGVETQAIDLSRVSINSVTWSVCNTASSIPDHEFLIISN